MELNLDREKVLKIPTEKKKLKNRSNEIFAAKINSGDQNINGIVENEIAFSRYNELKEYIEEALSL